MPSDEADWRKVLAFAKKMGIEALDIQPTASLPSSPPSGQKPAVEILASGPAFSGRGLQVLEQLCDWHGIVLAQNQAQGIAFSRPEDFLLPWEIVPLDALGGKEESVSYLLERMHREGRKPTMFSVELGSDPSVSTNSLAQTIAAFNNASTPLAKGGRS
jgi:hypothetical protein